MFVSEQGGVADAIPLARPEQQELASPESSALPCGLRLPASVSPHKLPQSFLRELPVSRVPTGGPFGTPVSPQPLRSRKCRSREPAPAWPWSEKE